MVRWSQPYGPQDGLRWVSITIASLSTSVFLVVDLLAHDADSLLFFSTAHQWSGRSWHWVTIGQPLAILPIKTCLQTRSSWFATRFVVRRSGPERSAVDPNVLDGSLLQVNVQNLNLTTVWICSDIRETRESEMECVSVYVWKKPREMYFPLNVAQL
jgi:hypothetical protein